MKKLCKTCRYWDGEDKDWGECSRAGSTNAQADDELSLAVAYDFEGYSAGLSTRAEFGCVQWEKKENAHE